LAAAAAVARAFSSWKILIDLFIFPLAMHCFYSTRFPFRNLYIQWICTFIHRICCMLKKKHVFHCLINYFTALHFMFNSYMSIWFVWFLIHTLTHSWVFRVKYDDFNWHDNF
jgi:hypothetical protein